MEELDTFQHRPLQASFRPAGEHFMMLPFFAAVMTNPVGDFIRIVIASA
jgi:hypothetical protein